MSARILLTGSRGQVGWELARSLSTLGDLVALDSSQLDLTDVAAIRSAVAKIQPLIIVNSAAHTAVDKAESEVECSYALNATAPGVLAEEAEKLGALLVHYSTDYVFDGSGDQARIETDATRPLNVYGASKLAGEQAIQAACRRHLIFRTSWVYGERGTNFLLTMRRLMRERPELKIIADQIGAPTWCRNIADATAQVLAQVGSPSVGADKPQPWGVYHMTNAGETSWHGFAQAILELDAPDSATRLLPIPSSDYPTPAKRPLNSRLNNNKLERVFGVHMPDWQVALRMCIAV
jgi:dTDP-4-dehydrorhamnose reductase